MYCAAPDGSQLEEIKCGEKPRTRRSCKKKKPCGGYWFEGPWSQVTVTELLTGVWKYQRVILAERQVNCHKILVQGKSY